jgi:hypothetical protein
MQIPATKRSNGAWRTVAASFSAFVAAGLRPTTPLARAIVLVLVVKLVAVVAMKVFLFSGDQNPSVDRMVMSRIVGPSPSP